MKKMFVSLSIALAATLPAIAEAPLEPGRRVLEEFKREFSTAQNVTWEKQDEFDKATFVFAGRRVIAYFNGGGQLEGCVREIFFDQLPLSVMAAVDKKFPAAEVLTVREITNAEGTHYRVLLETKTKKVTMKVTPGGSISELEKQAR